MSTIKLRRSAVPGRIPTTAQLELGEIAINTNDGKLYFKKFDIAANTETIVDVSADLDASAILSLLLGVDGTGSGLDADLLDGQEGTYYLDWNNFTNTATGVSANTYGSSTAIPVITIDADGRITSANTVAVAGVDDLSYTPANNTILLTTGDGTEYLLKLNQFDENVDFGAGIDVTGDITVTGLVDGRDIAADGLKLDTLEDGLDLTLTGKVTGTATSNTGVMTLATELANTGVTPGVYGSSTEIPIFTVDEDGRLTTANTTAVAGVDDFSYSNANNTITLETGDGTVFHIATETTVALSGDVTGTVTSDSGELQITTDISASGVTANTYGSATAIPVITVADDGRITLASTTAVAGVSDFTYESANNSLLLETGDGSFYIAPITTFGLNTDFSAGIDVTGNITVTGLVDGRDIFSDGQKLDTIESNATADQTPAEILAALLTVDGDGSGLDADSIDGYSASEILDAAANNAANLIGAGEVEIFGSASINVTGDTLFNLNSSNTFNITVEHGNTSSITDVSLSLPNVLTGLTFDTFGHVQTHNSVDLDTRYYTQTLLNSGQLDSRYYTETESDSRFVNVTGDTVTGNLQINGDVIRANHTEKSITFTASSTSQVSILNFDTDDFGGAEVVIVATDGTSRHITKLLITHDGSTAIATEFGVVYTGSELATYDVSVNGSDFDLMATSVSGSTVYKIVATLIDY